MGIKMATNAKTMPVYYGGVFSVQKKRVLDQSMNTWENIEKSLTREDNLEGHYVERLWASMLYGINSNNDDGVLASVIDEFVEPLVDSVNNACGMEGMLMTRREKIEKQFRNLPILPPPEEWSAITTDEDEDEDEDEDVPEPNIQKDNNTPKEEEPLITSEQKSSHRNEDTNHEQKSIQVDHTTPEPNIQKHNTTPKEKDRLCI